MSDPEPAHPSHNPPRLHLQVERHGAVTLILLNRPGQRNALNDALRGELAAAVEAFDRDPDQRVAVLTGSGSAFCAGADLRELKERAGTDVQPIASVSTSICGVGDSPKPWVAAVNGPAVAGGLELVLNCDLRITASEAWFALPEVSLGLLPGVAVHQLARQMAWGDAMWLLIAGERVSSEAALRLGLVQEVVDDGVVDRALEVASRVAEYPTSAVQTTKAIARRWRDHDLAATMEHYLELNRAQFDNRRVVGLIVDALSARGGSPYPTATSSEIDGRSVNRG